MTNLLFVYGTLKTDGAVLPGLLNGLPFTPEGGGTVRGVWLQGTPYPAVIREENGTDIPGELIRLHAFAESIRVLDAYEECDFGAPARSLYTRECVPVTRDSGAADTAWVYFFNPYFGEQPL